MVGNCKRIGTGQVIHFALDGHVEDEYNLRNYHNLPGTHNYYNIMAAIAICRQVGLSHNEIMAGLRSFKGLPNRIEALVVVILLIDGFHIQMGQEDMVDDNIVGFLIPMIKVYCSDNCFESIAIHAVTTELAALSDHVMEAQLHGLASRAPQSVAVQPFSDLTRETTLSN